MMHAARRYLCPPCLCNSPRSQPTPRQAADGVDKTQLIAEHRVLAPGCNDAPMKRMMTLMMGQSDASSAAASQDFSLRRHGVAGWLLGGSFCRCGRNSLWLHRSAQTRTERRLARWVLLVNDWMRQAAERGAAAMKRPRVVAGGENLQKRDLLLCAAQDQLDEVKADLSAVRGKGNQGGQLLGGLADRHALASMAPARYQRGAALLVLLRQRTTGAPTVGVPRPSGWTRRGPGYGAGPQAADGRRCHFPRLRYAASRRRL